MRGFAGFQTCFGCEPLTDDCLTLDSITDDTIDLADYAEFRFPSTARDVEACALMHLPLTHSVLSSTSEEVRSCQPAQFLFHQARANATRCAANGEPSPALAPNSETS